jgi:hypothetical protein
MMIATRRQFSTVPAMRYRRGMGATGSQIIGVTGETAGSLFGTVISASKPLQALLGISGPVGLAIGGAVAAVTGLLSAFGVGSGCGQSCIQASNDANQIEQAMKANLAAFQAGQITQTEALQNFDGLWAQLTQACGQIGGGAGSNCVSDRQEGACKWKDSSGACWNWFVGYRDPIANAASASPAAGGSLVPLLAAGAVGLIIAEAL